MQLCSLSQDDLIGHSSSDTAPGRSLSGTVFFFFGIEPDHVIGNDIGTYVIASRDTCHLYNVVHRGGSGLYITRNFGLGIEITFSSCLFSIVAWSSYA